MQGIGASVEKTEKVERLKKDFRTKEFFKN